MKTPIRDWGVVNFLQDKGADIGQSVIKNITDVVLRGESPVKAVADIIRGEGGKKLSQEDIARAFELAETDAKRMEQEIEMERLENQDRESARRAEKVRLKSDDKFITRFTYILALVMLAGSFSLLGLLIFIKVPEANETLINVAFGVMFTTGLASIFQYYFGSSDNGK